MAGEERSLEISQAGKETTRGTAVAATRKIYMPWQPASPERDTNWAPTMTGTRNNRREASYGIIRNTLTGTQAVAYEDEPWWLQHILEGGVTGVGDSETPEAFTWAFSSQPTASGLWSSTLEYGTPTLAWEANQGMANSATWRFSPDDAAYWERDVEMMTRKPSATTMTPALMDYDRTLVRAPGTKIFIDSASGDIGDTQITGRFIGGSITLNNNLDFKAFAEDETDVAANRVGFGDLVVDAQFSFEFDSATEYNYFIGSEPVDRFIRIQREGAIIHDAIRERIRFDMAGVWTTAPVAYRNNNRIVNFGFGAKYDPALTYDLAVEVVNTVETLT